MGAIGEVERYLLALERVTEHASRKGIGWNATRTAKSSSSSTLEDDIKHRQMNRTLFISTLLKVEGGRLK